LFFIGWCGGLVPRRGRCNPWSQPIECEVFCFLKGRLRIQKVTQYSLASPLNLPFKAQSPKYNYK